MESEGICTGFPRWRYLSCRLRGEEFSVSVNSLIKQAHLKKLYDDLGTLQTSGDLKTSKTVADYKRLITEV